MTLLIFCQSSGYSVYIHSLLRSLRVRGYMVYFASLDPEHTMHKTLRADNFVAFSLYYGDRKVDFVKSLFRLYTFSNRNKVNIILSHLQLANLMSLLVGMISRVRVLPCRHHSTDVFLGGNKNSKRIDKLVNLLSNKMLVVSDRVKAQMVEFENCKESKIFVTPLFYDFSLYSVKETTTSNSQLSNSQGLNIICVARMTKNKNHLDLLTAIKNLIGKSFILNLTLIDTGPEYENIKKFVVDHSLQNFVHFTGKVDNVLDYISKSDLLVLTSISEASNQVVKEASILAKPSVVVNGVGDFNEYLTHLESTYFLRTDSIADDLVDSISYFYKNRNELAKIGGNARDAVNKKFGQTNIKTLLQLINN